MPKLFAWPFSYKKARVSASPARITNYLVLLEVPPYQMPWRNLTIYRNAAWTVDYIYDIQEPLQVNSDDSSVSDHN